MKELLFMLLMSSRLMGEFGDEARGGFGFELEPGLEFKFEFEFEFMFMFMFMLMFKFELEVEDESWFTGEPPALGMFEVFEVFEFLLLKELDFVESLQKTLTSKEEMYLAAVGMGKQFEFWMNINCSKKSFLKFKLGSFKKMSKLIASNVE